jgi:hypothetical protein
MRFPLGKITITIAAASALAATNTHLFTLLVRHGHGDAGECSVPNSEANCFESWYHLPGSSLSVWISTEMDLGATRVWLDEEAHDAV